MKFPNRWRTSVYGRTTIVLVLALAMIVMSGCSDQGASNNNNTSGTLTNPTAANGLAPNPGGLTTTPALGGGLNATATLSTSGLLNPTSTSAAGVLPVTGLDTGTPDVNAMTTATTDAASSAAGVGAAGAAGAANSTSTPTVAALGNTATATTAANAAATPTESGQVTLITPTVITPTPEALLSPTPTKKQGGREEGGGKTPEPTLMPVYKTSTALAVTGTPSANQTATPAPAGSVPNTAGNPFADFPQANPQQEAMGLGILNQRYNPNVNINADNPNITPGWSIPTDGLVTGQPMVENGKVYFADWSGTVYAADAASGKMLWKKKVESPKMEWPWHGFAGGIALGNGNVYVASIEGKAFALDEQTGNVVWEASITDDPQAGSLSNIQYYDGLLYIGLSSVEEPLSKKTKMPLTSRGTFWR